MNFQYIDCNLVNGIGRENSENHKDDGFEYVGYRRRLVVVALCNIEIHRQSDVSAQTNAACPEEQEYESVGRAPGGCWNEHSYDIDMEIGEGAGFDVQVLGKDAYVAVVALLPPSCDESFPKARGHSDKRNPASDTNLFKYHWKLIPCPPFSANWNPQTDPSEHRNSSILVDMAGRKSVLLNDSDMDRGNQSQRHRTGSG